LSAVESIEAELYITISSVAWVLIFFWSYKKEKRHALIVLSRRALLGGPFIQHLMIALENKVTMDDLSAAADHVLASFDEGLSEQTQRAMAGARVTACDDRAHADRSSEHAILRFSALRADECRRWVADATDNELTSVTSGMRELHGAWMAGEARSINLELNKQQHAEEEARGITRRRLTLLACESDFRCWR